MSPLLISHIFYFTIAGMVVAGLYTGYLILSKKNPRPTEYEEFDKNV